MATYKSSLKPECSAGCGHGVVIPAKKAWALPGRQPHGTPGETRASHIAQLKEMGFTEDSVRQALAESVWDVNKAIDLLMAYGAFATMTVNVSGSGHDGKTCVDKLPLTEAARLAESENSTCASVVSSSRSSWQSVSGSSHTCAQEVPASSNCEWQKPWKPLCQVRCSWNNTDQDQLSVQEGGFVRIWPASENGMGWIYAESAFDSFAGWLPASVLEPRTEDKCWMIVQKTMPAVHHHQLDIQEGDFVEVDLASRCEAGWTYATRRARPDQREVGATEFHEFSQAGWVPTSSLHWEDGNVLPDSDLEMR